MQEAVPGAGYPFCLPRALVHVWILWAAHVLNRAAAFPVCNTNAVVFNCCLLKVLIKLRNCCLLSGCSACSVNGPYGEGLLLQQSELQMLLSGNA